MEYVNFNCPDCSKTHTCSVCERCNRNIANGTTTMEYINFEDIIADDEKWEEDFGNIRRPDEEDPYDRRSEQR